MKIGLSYRNNSQIKVPVNETTQRHRDDFLQMDEQVFERVFKEHFKSLHSYAQAILKDAEAAEEVVQTVFLKLWEKKGSIQIKVSPKAYLYKAVYYESLNYLKHLQVKMEHKEQTLHEMAGGAFWEGTSSLEGQENELYNRLQHALTLLPQKCREVFCLSRFEELKYIEIAQRLGVSVKTVEAHMGKALKTMRLELAEFLPVFLLLIFNFKHLLP